MDARSIFVIFDLERPQGACGVSQSSLLGIRPLAFFKGTFLPSQKQSRCLRAVVGLNIGPQPELATQFAVGSSGGRSIITRETPLHASNALPSALMQHAPLLQQFDGEMPRKFDRMKIAAVCSQCRAQSLAAVE
jgi:hypothetical protein